MTGRGKEGGKEGSRKKRERREGGEEGGFVWAIICGGVDQLSDLFHESLKQRNTVQLSP